MTDVAASSSNAATLTMSELNRMIEDTSSLADLLDNFSNDEVGSASAQRALSAFGDELKNIINDASNLPEFIKQAACNCIDNVIASSASESCCSHACSDAVANSTIAPVVDQAGTDVANQADAVAVTNSNPAPATLSFEEQQSMNEEAVENGGEMPFPAAGMPGDTPEAGAVSSEAPAAGGAAPAGGESGEVDLAAEEARNAGSTAKKGRNWLEALALSLSNIQSTFLDRAMAASEVMAGEANNASGDNAAGGRSKEFLDAQAEYTANMQLFNIFSQQVSTSIKTLGEALSAISRKQ